MTACQLVPFSADPLAATAQQVLEHYRDKLPDLSRCQILLPDMQCAPSLRAVLLDQADALGYPALLGPRIDTLDSWLASSTPPRKTVIDRPSRELILAEALRNSKSLYADTDPWLLADELLTLFDDMTRAELMPEDYDAFEEQLQKAYGLRQPSPVLQQEAWMLYTLWCAWRQQLDEDQLTDPASARRQQLEDDANRTSSQILWLVGFTRFSPAESRWLEERLQRGEARLILHGDTQGEGYHPHTPLNDLLVQLNLEAPVSTTPKKGTDAFINALFGDTTQHLAERARLFADSGHGNPFVDRLKTFCADNPEQEAQAVAMQIRLWLLDDPHGSIAIVTGDRRLARRVRALLENSQISLDDAGGWALSTTSAAALLERWLETVEEDFACAPLLDVLKSPFLFGDKHDEHLEQVRRLEQDIILHENIARGLDRYRHHLDRRSARLPDWGEASRQALHELLNHLDHAASPLLAALEEIHPAAIFLNALAESLDELGATEALQSDDAGQQLLVLLDELQTASQFSPAGLSWREFRDWLGRNLERSHFHPANNGSPVRLLTLEQSRLQRFSGVVFAGCSRDQLPGKPGTHAFFNQRVRSELGLPAWSQTLAERLHHFCRLLSGNSRMLLTRHLEQDGEPVAASPWLELLEVFYRNAFGTSLADTSLGTLLKQPQVFPATPDDRPLPHITLPPAPPSRPALLPDRWSASTHQRIIDCPYRFFAADALRLKPAEEITEALSKADYGSLVHRIIQAFNSDVDGLPGPWQGSIDESRRDDAQALLKHISLNVFTDAMTENFEARSWYIQWSSVLSEYLDWEIKRREAWPWHESEINVGKSLTDTLKIGGRIDRLDRNSSAVALVDYKTGATPSAQQVQDGEAVQLPSYALAVNDVIQLDYLKIGKDTIKPTTCADRETLGALLPALLQRLLTLDTSLQQQAALPAWGDDKTCNWCEFDGLCRRGMWQRKAPEDD
ncbi:ATP-dependent helicase/nuclease subunit B [Thiogranum longum]|uniref:ATP-dependent helicase/nuclease subunit B n=1 Tax=Thiogranum longum TaxID=1537524 RepID=A0A4R1HEZ8_9GAMM|nr:PD-(D/E)XK nuclease family protein [Thiogranum longum]TCK18905.1 ATP-dependent helicase/nuclease subunit B [Thiogranum longum]